MQRNLMHSTSNYQLETIPSAERIQSLSQAHRYSLFQSALIYLHTPVLNSGTCTYIHVHTPVLNTCTGESGHWRKMWRCFYFLTHFYSNNRAIFPTFSFVMTNLRLLFCFVHTNIVDRHDDRCFYKKWTNKNCKNHNFIHNGFRSHVIWCLTHLMLDASDAWRIWCLTHLMLDASDAWRIWCLTHLMRDASDAWCIWCLMHLMLDASDAWCIWCLTHLMLDASDDWCIWWMTHLMLDASDAWRIWCLMLF